MVSDWPGLTAGPAARPGKQVEFVGWQRFAAGVTFSAGCLRAVEHPVEWKTSSGSSLVSARLHPRHRAVAVTSSGAAVGAVGEEDVGWVAAVSSARPDVQGADPTVAGSFLSGGVEGTPCEQDRLVGRLQCGGPVAGESSRLRHAAGVQPHQHVTDLEARVLDPGD